MKAIEITAFGGPEALQMTERAIPEPGDDEVLIRVRAAGVNRPDILQRLGKYPPPPGITDIPGLEVAGEIVESNSNGWRAGDKICALLAGGGYAEYAVAPAGQCLPLPGNLDFTEGAALPEAVFTVWNNLFGRGCLKNGEGVLIHGGSSGIGTMAIQMAKAFGANPVIVTAGTAEKCAACLELGATGAINYKEHDFEEEVTRITNGAGVDIILDMVGGSYVPKNLNLLKEDGRHVSIAFIGGQTSEIDIRQVMAKRLILTGSTLRNRPEGEKAELARQIREQVWPKIEDRSIRSVIHSIMPLEEAAASHRIMERGDHIGKIILITG